MALRQLVPAPRATPPITGLIASAQLMDNESYDLWRGGITYRPETGGEAGIISGICGTEVEKPIDDAEDIVEWDPYQVWAGDKCSAFSFQANDFARIASDRLKAKESSQIAHELWTGEQAQAEGLVNHWLADDTSPNFVNLSPGAGQSPGLYALAALQEHIIERGGQRSMIHATVTTLDLWYSKMQIRRDGRLFLDIYDNIVVADFGYDGSSPDGTIDATGETQWAYITGIVRVRRGPIVVLPEAGRWDQATNRSTNLVEWRAERPAMAEWDLVLHAGINVNVCDTAC